VIGLAALGVLALGVVVVATWLVVRAENRAEEAEAQAQEIARLQEAQAMARRQDVEDHFRQLRQAVRLPADGALAKKDWDPMVMQILPFIEQQQGGFLAPGGKLVDDPALPADARRLGELLNVKFRTVDPTLGRHLGLAEGEGLVVAFVQDNWRAMGPGDLQPHDVLVQLGGTRVKAAESAGLLEVARKGQGRVDAAVLRDGRRVELKGVPVLHKAAEGPPRGKP
jgi:hypothetical protein